jgi:hypothetical protein
MVKRKGVNMIVDEDFFNIFEKQRQKEQAKLRQKLGGMFNLGQKNFTALLAAKNFKFEVPKQRRLERRKRR